MAVDCALSIVGKIGEYLVAPIGRQLGYLIYYNNNIDGLRNQAEKLKIVEADIQGLVRAAEMTGEDILQTVQNWLGRVAVIVEESDELLNDQVKANQMCFGGGGGGSCPDLNSRYQVSRKAKKKTFVVNELLREKFDRVSIPAPPNIENLKNQVAKLKSVQVDVQGLVEDAKRKGEVILQTVQLWLERVPVIVEESEKFFKENQMCVGGRSFPELKSLVDQLILDGEKFDRVSIPAPPNIDSLRDQVAKLKIVQVDVQGLVEDAERKGEIILQTVQDWLERVPVIVEESEKFFNENQICVGGRSFPELKSLVDQLLRDAMFDKVSRPAPPPSIASTIMGDSEVFASREYTFNDIMKALKNDNVNIIGVSGMGGVGKTTLVKEVMKQAEKSKLFDEIVMAVVSQTPSTKKIQGEIADRLQLELKQNSEFERAGQLCERLKKVKRILVILDDVWTELDLAAIGIPYGNVHKGCKIVLTSRDQDVCTQMNAQVNFPIKVLSPSDAWNLFRRTAGDSVDSQDLLPIATEVAKECAGLPIAIVTVAKALKGKRSDMWRDALHQLRSSTPKNIKGMHANVYSSLELSFNFLESEEVKYIFLLCCLFPEDFDIPIENLVRYGMGLRLFESVHKLEEARHRAHFLVDNLKACCLLLDGNAEGFVRMHDVIRDFAISVASKGQHVFLVRAAAGLEEWPETDAHHHHTAIGLLGNKFHELPDGLDCPKLNLLMLGCDSNKSLKIPDSFFGGMKMLRVVDMRADLRDIPSLPSSIHYLKNLRTLCLESCNLIRDISLIGGLRSCSKT